MLWSINFLNIDTADQYFAISVFDHIYPMVIPAVCVRTIKQLQTWQCYDLKQSAQLYFIVLTLEIHIWLTAHTQLVSHSFKIHTIPSICACL